MSRNWLYTPDCKVLNEMAKQSKAEGMNEGCTLQGFLPGSPVSQHRHLQAFQITM